MEYLKTGSGDIPLIVIPGLSVKSPLKDKERLEQKFSIFDKHTVYVCDVREDYQKAETLKDYADIIARELKKENIRNADVYGASMGGMISQSLAIDHPDLVRRLVLGSTCARHNETSSALVRKWLMFAIRGNGPGLYEDTVNSIFSENTLSLHRDEIMNGFIGVTFEELAQYVAMLNASSRFDRYDELNKISCPTLVIGCEGDKVLTPASSAELAEKLGCELYMYGSEYGHAVYDEAPDYLERVRTFLS